MTDIKHTPAPWNTWTSNAPYAPVVIYKGDIPPKLGKYGNPIFEAGSYIASVSSSHMHFDENENIIKEDNAHLIVVAPEMYCKICDLIDYFDQRQDADCDQDGYIPNEEMRIYQELIELKAKAEGKT